MQQVELVVGRHAAATWNPETILLTEDQVEQLTDFRVSDHMPL